MNGSVRLGTPSAFSQSSMFGVCCNYTCYYIAKFCKRVNEDLKSHMYTVGGARSRADAFVVGADVMAGYTRYGTNAGGLSATRGNDGQSRG
jgi:hypothetical protein